MLLLPPTENPAIAAGLIKHVLRRWEEERVRRPMGRARVCASQRTHCGNRSNSTPGRPVIS